MRRHELPQMVTFAEDKNSDGKCTWGRGHRRPWYIKVPLFSRPQRSCSKAMFYTCLSFCSQGEVCPDTPLGRPLPLDRHPLWADTPLGKHPLRQTPRADTPLGRHTSPLLPPRYSHCSGRYASYLVTYI